MEEIEVPMENLHETVKEKAEEALNEPIGKWMMLGSYIYSINSRVCRHSRIDGRA